MKLPGFKCQRMGVDGIVKVPLDPLPTNLYDTTYTHLLTVGDEDPTAPNASQPYATWNAATEELDFQVRKGFVVANPGRGKVTSIFMDKDKAMFVLPGRIN